MKKSLFDKEEGYTKDALGLTQKAEKILYAAFKRYMAKGFKAREIAHLIEQEVQRVESSVILEARRKGLYAEENKEGNE
jgi:hypothetical protein